MITRYSTLSLSGLDGANPLGMLAALGAFRTLDRIEPDGRVAMSWTNMGNQWTPVVHTQSPWDKDQLIAALTDELRTMANHPALTFAKNLRIQAKTFRNLAKQAVDHAIAGSGEVYCAFLAAFGCDAIEADNGEIEDTALRTMSGAGHQHFLQFMNQLACEATKENLNEALFGPWRYRDSGPSLRFDPMDDRRYALRWKNPSQDASTTVRGANRLAVEGVPMFPTTPMNNQLETTGFVGHKSDDTFWTWPIWEPPISLDTCQALLGLAELSAESPDRERLRARGVLAAYRSQRITIGKFRNFTPARAL